MRRASPASYFNAIVRRACANRRGSGFPALARRSDRTVLRRTTPLEAAAAKAAYEKLLALPSARLPPSASRRSSRSSMNWAPPISAEGRPERRPRYFITARSSLTPSRACSIRFRLHPGRPAAVEAKRLKKRQWPPFCVCWTEGVRGGRSCQVPALNSACCRALSVTASASSGAVFALDAADDGNPHLARLFPFPADGIGEGRWWRWRSSSPRCGLFGCRITAGARPWRRSPARPRCAPLDKDAER